MDSIGAGLVPTTVLDSAVTENRLMKPLYQLAFFALLATVSCTNNSEDIKDYAFEKNILFNHLYIVIDSITYKHLSDSLPFLADFSIMSESKTDAGDESWSGKYLYGENHYVEIFSTEGYEGAKPGDVGIGFMPNKIGTLDSLYRKWSHNLDSVDRFDRTMMEDGVTYPWFTAISIPNVESLHLNIWLMEYDREHMLDNGFTSKDLMGEIDHWDYTRHKRAKNLRTSPDSITYGKLFEKISAVHLTLSENEVIYLRQNLLDFGFTEHDNTFHGNDIDVKYEIDGKRDFILRQIDFKLSGSLEKSEYSIGSIDVIVTGNEASFKFNY